MFLTNKSDAPGTKPLDMSFPLETHNVSAEYSPAEHIFDSVIFIKYAGEHIATLWGKPRIVKQPGHLRLYIYGVDDFAPIAIIPIVVFLRWNKNQRRVK